MGGELTPPDRHTVELRLLGDALDLAMAVARRDQGTPAAPVPPAPLRRFLRFRDLPAPTGTAAVREVLDTDDAFRSRVVEQSSELLEGDTVDEAARLFLVRPEGWRDDLDTLVDTAVEAEARGDAARQEASALRRVEQLEQAAERLRAELAESAAEVERLGARLDEERARRRSQELAAGQARAESERLAGERATAVRQLAEARTLAESRLTDLRRAEADLAASAAEAAGLRDRPAGAGAPAGGDEPAATGAPAPAPEARGPGTAAPTVVDPAVAEAVGRAATALTRLAEELGGLARTLRGPGATGPGGGHEAVGGATAAPPAPVRSGRGSVPAAGPAGGAGAGGGGGPRRRVRTQLRRGALDGTPDGTRQYLSAPGAVAVVDGYNVSMTGWPALEAGPQREALLGCLTDVARRTGAEVHVVFDGEDDGRRPAVTSPLDVRVHFSPSGVEADDVVLDLVDRLPVERPVVVVSSDRRVRDGARDRGAAVVASADLLACWRAGPG